MYMCVCICVYVYVCECVCATTIAVNVECWCGDRPVNVEFDINLATSVTSERGKTFVSTHMAPVVTIGFKI
jgi:hypothetical protein